MKSAKQNYYTKKHSTQNYFNRIKTTFPNYSLVLSKEATFPNYSLVLSKARHADDGYKNNGPCERHRLLIKLDPASK